MCHFRNWAQGARNITKVCRGVRLQQNDVCTSPQKERYRWIVSEMQKCKWRVTKELVCHSYIIVPLAMKGAIMVLFQRTKWRRVGWINQYQMTLLCCLVLVEKSFSEETNGFDMMEDKHPNIASDNFPSRPNTTNKNLFLLLNFTLCSIYLTGPWHYS